jgi:hypothetical protein
MWYRKEVYSGTTGKSMGTTEGYHKEKGKGTALVAGTGKERSDYGKTYE